MFLAGGVNTQEDTQRDHKNDQWIARPSLKGKDAGFFAFYRINAADIIVGKFRKAKAIDDCRQNDPRNDKYRCCTLGCRLYPS